MTTVSSSARDDRRRAIDFSRPVLALVVALLAIMIVLPMGWLMVYAFATKDGEIKGMNKDGASHTLKKIERKSPTLGAKPAPGAIVLFDGTNADAWKNGKIDKDGNLQCGVLSKQEFGDSSLHLEFFLPF